MSKLILENWEDYNSEKRLRGLDENYFLCTEKWETDYLKCKIIEQYPFLSETIVLFAIQYVYSRIPTPVKRNEFVQRVAILLDIPDAL